MKAVRFVCHRTPPHRKNGCLALTRVTRPERKSQVSRIFIFPREAAQKRKWGKTKGPAPGQILLWGNYAILAAKFKILSLFDRPARSRT